MLGKQTLCQLSYSRSGGRGRSPCGENLPLEPGDGRADGTRVLDAWLLAARVRCGLVGPAAVASSKVDWRWRLQAPGIARGTGRPMGRWYHWKSEKGGFRRTTE